MPRTLLAVVFGLLSSGGCAGYQHWAGRSTPTQADLILQADSAAPAVVARRNPSSDSDSPVVSAHGANSCRPVQAVDVEARQSDETAASGSDPAGLKSERTVALISLSEPAGSLSAGDSGVSDSQTLLPPGMDMNLPTALAMVGGQHPAVGLARWRVQEAYAVLEQAEVLWLPSIQAGFSFHRHDGNTQTTTGQIVDLNRNSFQYGLGTGANAAGTTQNPGLVAQFHLADAVFQPAIAQKALWAQQHAQQAVLNQQLLNAAVSYLDLLSAFQDVRILEESDQRMSELSVLTTDFAAAGAGLAADADRLSTEVRLVESRLIDARQRVRVASARLSQALSIKAADQIRPTDVTVLPLNLITSVSDQYELIRTGLATRPELRESQALVAAACEAWRREKYAPFVPSLLLGFSTGGFGGGTGNRIDQMDGRYDVDAIATWEIRNLGFGEQAARRTASARVEQARFEKIRVMDQVAREISEAASEIEHRRQQIQVTQQAIQSAQSSWQLNLARIRDGQGLPLEVLQSVQALETARRAYLQALIEHNQAQFRLQWALGWPVSANTVQESGSHPFVVPPSGGICTGYHNCSRLKAGRQANMERYCR